MRLSSSLVPLAALLGSVALSVMPVQAQRKREKPPELAVAPPPVVARQISVRPGETVQVPLAIHGTRDAQMEFLIRAQPRGGKLGPVKRTGAESAVVDYTAGAQPGNDRFLYAVRSADGVSAPGAVDITIIVAPQIPARLGTPEGLEFPAVTLGKQTSATLTVTNQGGGVAEGAVEVPAGWTVEGDPRYVLPAGQTADFKIVFRPTRAGEWNGQAVLGPKPRRVVPLHAMVVAPLELYSEQLDLATKPGTQTRMGVLRLKNRSEEPRQLNLQAGPRVLIDAAVTIQPGETLELPVLVDAEDPAKLEDTLRLQSGEWKAEVPLRALPLGAVVKVVESTGDFGRVRLGQTGEVRLTLQNMGGMPGVAALKVEPPFTVSAAGVQVPARGKIEVPVRVEPVKAGRFTSNLVIEAGGPQEVLPLTVEVEASPGNEPPPSVPVAASANGEPSPTPSAPVARAAGNTALKLVGTDAKGLNLRKSGDGVGALPGFGEVPAPMGRFTRDVKSNSAVLVWPKQIGTGTTVSERQLGLSPAKELQVTWTPRPAEFADAGDHWEARLTDLQSGRLYVVKVASGAKTLLATQFITAAKQPFFNFGWRAVVLTLMSVGLAVIVWRKWKARGRRAW